MLDVIFITGCPASGKSTIAKLLQEKLKSPMFEFGWIPEFKLLNIVQSYEDEEKLSFENLNLVVKNYIKHGYSNIIIADIRDDLLTQVPIIYKNFSNHIFTLIPELNDIKSRIQERKVCKNGFANFDLAVKSYNHWIDSKLKYQTKIQTLNYSPDLIYENIYKYIQLSST